MSRFFVTYDLNAAIFTEINGRYQICAQNDQGYSYYKPRYLKMEYILPGKKVPAFKLEKKCHKKALHADS